MIQFDKSLQLGLFTTTGDTCSKMSVEIWFVAKVCPTMWTLESFDVVVLVQMTDEMKDQNRAIVKVSFTVGNEIETDTITLDIEG